MPGVVLDHRGFFVQVPGSGIGRRNFEFSGKHIFVICDIEIVTHETAGNRFAGARIGIDFENFPGPTLALHPFNRFDNRI